MKLVAKEGTLILTGVSPIKFSSSIFLPGDIFAFESSTVGPSFDSVAVLLVVLPLSSVSGTVRVFVDSLTVKFVVAPLTLVNITVGEDSPTLSVDLIVPPVALKQRTISSDLFSITVTFSSLGIPLALVN